MNKKDRIPTARFIENRAKNRLKIATIITEALKRKGIKKMDFAAMMGTSPSVVSKWLSGNCNFEIYTLFNIERLLDITIVDVLSGKNKQNGNTNTCERPA